MLKLCIIIIYVFQIKTKPSFNGAQRLLTTLINDLRESPKSFSKYLEKNFISKFSHKIYKNKIETIEGPYAFKEASHYLKRLPSRFPLKLSSYFSKIAENHSKSMSALKKVSHYSNGKTPISILKKKGKIFGKLTQIVTKVDKEIGSLITILAFLIADDGVEDRLNCKAIMYADFEIVGVGVVEDEKDCYVTVILGDVYEPGLGFKEEIEDYKGLEGELEVLKGDEEVLGDLVNGLKGNIVEKITEKSEEVKKEEGKVSKDDKGDTDKDKDVEELMDNEEIEENEPEQEEEVEKNNKIENVKEEENINENNEGEEEIDPEELDDISDYDLENLFHENEEESTKKMLAVKELYDNLDDMNKTISTLN